MFSLNMVDYPIFPLLLSSQHSQPLKVKAKLYLKICRYVMYIVYMLFLTFLHMWYGQVVVTQFNQRRVVVPNLQTIVFIFLSLISRQISVHTTCTHQVTLNLTKIHNPASFSNFHHKLFVLDRFPEF